MGTGQWDGFLIAGFLSVPAESEEGTSRHPQQGRSVPVPVLRWRSVNSHGAGIQK